MADRRANSRHSSAHSVPSTHHSPSSTWIGRRGGGEGGGKEGGRRGSVNEEGGGV